VWDATAVLPTVIARSAPVQMPDVLLMSPVNPSPRISETAARNRVRPVKKIWLTVAMRSHRSPPRGAHIQAADACS